MTMLSMCLPFESFSQMTDFHEIVLEHYFN